MVTAGPHVSGVKWRVWLPTLVLLGVLVVLVPLFWSRNFGFFVLAYFAALPVTALACLGLLICLFREKSPRRRVVFLALVASIVISISCTILLTKYEHDQLEFAFWYPFHHAMTDRYAKEDAIILSWDSWGFAGMDNDEYLVSNPSNVITNTYTASEWLRRHGSNCPAVLVQKMRDGLYLLTTYNCVIAL